MQIFGEMSFCGLTKGISPKICVLCVRVKISGRLNLFVLGSTNSYAQRLTG